MGRRSQQPSSHHRFGRTASSLVHALTRSIAPWGQRLKASRIARMSTRYATWNGSQLAAGMALSALMSLVALLTAAITATVAVVGSRPALLAELSTTFDATLPGLVKTENYPEGVLDFSAFIRTEGTWLTTGIALAIALWSATSMIAALGRAIRLMFGLTTTPTGLGGAKGRGLIGVVLLPLVLLLASALGVATDTASTWLVGAFGAQDPTLVRVTTGVSYLVSLLMYGFVGFVLIRVVAAVRPLGRDLWQAVGIIAVSSVALRVAGTTIVQLTKNPLMATATAILTVILWLNLQLQAILYACAWAANPPPITPAQGSAAPHDSECPNYVTLSAPHTLAWPHNPLTGALEDH
ncbi:YhjD/YihY/BrkB family envelope integrity protein [Schaalia suimastitidis]|uniref:YhjD/YihY/BrkB family envelope integrity protein n=1 Tax=Schaalia suimastitidis TaxID=121163 RepID=UPI0004055523|nr:YhjD/YihY/BrkB family envelope integrity protein [Schaalia suimastitidis]